MAYDRDDIRRWVADCNEEHLKEAFSPMRSIAVDERPKLTEVKRNVVDSLVQEFFNHLSQSGIDVGGIPVHVAEAVRLVAESAFDAGNNTLED